MLGATASEPRGCWEPRAAIYINEVILQRHGSAGFDPTLRLHEEGAFNAEEKAACIARIRAYLATLPAAPLMVIKDPKITALSGMWFEAARMAGFDPMAVIAVRHPQEVTASIGKNLRASSELWNALWLKYSLLAERDTRVVPRVFVEYANLMKDWRREIKRISTALEVDLSQWDEGAIEEFLTPDLYRHRHLDAVAEPFGTDWISAVYTTLGAAARDEPWDRSELDRIFEAYRASEHGFRNAFEDFRRFRKLHRLVRPTIVKLNLGAFAMAHRRKGTWA
jgi:hypothetical protein